MAFCPTEYFFIAYCLLFLRELHLCLRHDHGTNAGPTGNRIAFIALGENLCHSIFLHGGPLLLFVGQPHSQH